MPEFQIQVTISRSPSNLVMNATNGYYIARDGIGPGEQTWRRNTVESTFVSGRVLTHAVRDTANISLAVRVTSDTPANLHTKINAMTQAFSQFSYTMTVLIDGVQYTWNCEPADWAIGDGGNFQDLHLRSNTQYVRLSIPRRP